MKKDNIDNAARFRAFYNRRRHFIASIAKIIISLAIEKGVRKMCKIASISSLVLLLSITGVYADIIELPLACEGRYDINSGPWEIDFDRGVTFTEISHVYIDWAGEIMAGLAVDPMRPGPQPFTEDVGLSAWLGSAPFWRHTSVYGGAATYPEPDVFDFKSEFELGSMPWSELFDGQCTIGISYIELIAPYLTYVESGFVDLSSATLIVEGTIVPEPGTLLLISVGIMGVRLRNNRS